MPRPGELDAKDRETDRYHDERWAWRNDHYDAEQQHRCTNDPDDEATCRLVGEVKCPPDQNLLRLDCFYAVPPPPAHCYRAASLAKISTLAAECTLSSPLSLLLISANQQNATPAQMIKPLRLICLLAAVVCFSAGASGTGKVLSLQAKVSSAELQPRDEERPLVQLPALEAAVIATVECGAGATPASLTVSISDTYQHFGAERLAESNVLEATFELPPGQLAPVSVAKFCVKGETTSNQSLELPGIATAQASLRCQGEDETTSMHFDSLPVPASLYCREAGDPESSSLER